MLSSFFVRSTRSALRFVLLALPGLIISSGGQVWAKSDPEILVVLSGFESDNGFVLVSLHHQKKSFPGDAQGAKKLARAKIKNRRATLRFREVPKGKYAISAFHDENNNQKLDTNFLGIPKEAVGASNNAKSSLGPPKWKDAVFEFNDLSITQKITLSKP